MQNLTILTGASRGMGLAMAQQLVLPGARLLCISRKRNPELQAQADVSGSYDCDAHGVQLVGWGSRSGVGAKSAPR